MDFQVLDSLKEPSPFFIVNSLNLEDAERMAKSKIKDYGGLKEVKLKVPGMFVNCLMDQKTISNSGFQ